MSSQIYANLCYIYVIACLLDLYSVTLQYFFLLHGMILEYQMILSCFLKPCSGILCYVTLCCSVYCHVSFMLFDAMFMLYIFILPYVVCTYMVFVTLWCSFTQHGFHSCRFICNLLNYRLTIYLWHKLLNHFDNTNQHPS